jgi:hypothetical protein
MKYEIKKMSNIGEVSVTRTEVSTGFLWDIDFIGCQLKDSIYVCNESNLPLMTVTNISLTCCGGILFNISESIQGSSPST